MIDSRERTRKDLVQAFWELYQTTDLEDITVKRVTQRAGYYRTTFYKYFDSIDDIMHYVHQSMMPENQKLNYGRFIDGHVDKFMETADYVVDLIGPGSDANFYEAHMNKSKNALRNLGFKNGELNSDEFDLIFEYLYAGSLFSLRRWYVSYRDRIPPHKIKELMREIYDRGFQDLLTAEEPAIGRPRSGPVKKK